MKLDFSDLLIIAGAALLLWGLYLFDYRLAMVGGGIFILLSGIVRLWYNALRR